MIRIARVGDITGTVVEIENHRGDQEAKDCSIFNLFELKWAGGLSMVAMCGRLNLHKHNLHMYVAQQLPMAE